MVFDESASPGLVPPCLEMCLAPTTQFLIVQLTACHEPWTLYDQAPWPTTAATKVQACGPPTGRPTGRCILRTGRTGHLTDFNNIISVKWPVRPVRKIRRPVGGPQACVCVAAVDMLWCLSRAPAHIEGLLSRETTLWGYHGRPKKCYFYIWVCNVAGRLVFG